MGDFRFCLSAVVFFSFFTACSLASFPKRLYCRQRSSFSVACRACCFFGFAERQTTPVHPQSVLLPSGILVRVSVSKLSFSSSSLPLGASSFPPRPASLEFPRGPYAPPSLVATGIHAGHKLPDHHCDRLSATSFPPSRSLTLGAFPAAFCFSDGRARLSLDRQGSFFSR